MAYSDFTLAKVRKQLGIKQKRVDHIFDEPILEITPSMALQHDIADGLRSPISTEKAKSEQLIFPVLKELKRQNPDGFTLFSGYTFNVDESRQLTGICDFMLAAKADIVEPEAPIFCLVEAKNGVIEDGFGQCTAEMVAARLFNEQDGHLTPVLYGCVTNGFEWLFLRLEGDTVYIDSTRFLIDQLPRLLGALQTILNRYKQPSCLNS